MNVLVADDDPVTRLLLGAALGKLGYNICQVANGQEAWQTWQAHHHPLVISDWMMPDLDGLEFCRRIRASECSNFTYSILLTARAGKKNYLDAMEAGATIYDLRGITEGLEADDPHLGLIQFKVGTGGEAVEYLGEWDLPLNPLLYKAFDLYMKRR